MVLEEHLTGCEACRQELNSLRAMQETLALAPMIEPSPNLLAQARMKLDEELDMIPGARFFDAGARPVLRSAGECAERTGVGNVAGGRGLSGWEPDVSVPDGACAGRFRRRRMW